MQFRRIIVLLVILFGTSCLCTAQYRFHTPDRHDLTSISYNNPHKNYGFQVSASVVAMFTTGVVDRSGVRLGAGFGVGYVIGDWTLSTGLDMYKARQQFGIGTSYAGVQYKDKYGYGGSYYLNRYYQGDKQMSGMISLMLDDFQVRFEDDILALPFTGFKIYDRFRTAALEVQFKHILLGTNVYSTDISGVTDVSLRNGKGVYKDGRQLSSPVYIGYNNWGMVARYGLNSRLGGFIGQNSWHRGLFGTPDFRSGGYKKQFLQMGVDKPYTLY